MTISLRDTACIWHPFTQHKMNMTAFPIVRGEGAYLFDENKKRYLDLISSWWLNLHGHAHPAIAEAIYQQALTLEHVVFAGFTHEPAVKLAEEILELLPGEFTKVFYSDNGSTAVEVALKMAFQYWRNLGNTKRKRFVAFENAYHGDTFGCMAMGKTNGFFTHFDELSFEVTTFPYPQTWLNDEDIAQKEQLILNQLTAYLDKWGEETAALLIEPLIQGAGGMRMCRPQFLRTLERLVREYGVLIIYDEVMTGFGRTGDFFACNKANTAPDIVCLAKGITGGFLPLAATVCQEKIYQAFLGDTFNKALAHGHSYTANPLGCAAGLASLKILKSPETILHIKTIEKIHQQVLKDIQTLIPVSNPRYCGTIAAFDLKLETPYGSGLNVALRERFNAQGLIIRPLGNVIYFMPPYCILEQELRSAYEIVIEEIQGVIA